MWLAADPVGLCAVHVWWHTALQRAQEERRSKEQNGCFGCLRCARGPFALTAAQLLYCMSLTEPTQRPDRAEAEAAVEAVARRRSRSHPRKRSRLKRRSRLRRKSKRRRARRRPSPARTRTRMTHSAATATRRLMPRRSCANTGSAPRTVRQLPMRCCSTVMLP